MICKNCGKEIDDSSIYCTECGTKVSSTIAEQPVVEDKPEADIAAENNGVAATSEPASAEPAADAAPSTVSNPYKPQSAEPFPREPQRQVSRFDGYQPYAQQNTQNFRQPPPAYAPPAPAPYQQKPAASETAQKPVSTGVYILLMIVGAIPLLGLLVHIIALAATKNKGFKNYCRAYVILGIILLVLTIAAFIVGYFMFDKVQEFLRQFNIDIEKSF